MAYMFTPRLTCDELYLTLSENNVEKHDCNLSFVVSFTAMRLNYMIIFFYDFYNLSKKREC